MQTHLPKLLLLLALLTFSCDPVSVVNIVADTPAPGLAVSKSIGSAGTLTEQYDGILIEKPGSLRFRVSSICQSSEVKDSCNFLFFRISIQMHQQFTFDFRQCKLVDRTGQDFFPNNATRRASSDGIQFGPNSNHEIVVGFGELGKTIRFPATLGSPEIVSGTNSIRLPNITAG